MTYSFCWIAHPSPSKAKKVIRRLTRIYFGKIQDLSVCMTHALSISIQFHSAIDIHYMSTRTPLHPPFAYRYRMLIYPKVKLLKPVTLKVLPFSLSHLTLVDDIAILPLVKFRREAHSHLHLLQHLHGSTHTRLHTSVSACRDLPDSELRRKARINFEGRSGLYADQEASPNSSPPFLSTPRPTRIIIQKNPRNSLAKKPPPFPLPPMANTYDDKQQPTK